MSLGLRFTRRRQERHPFILIVVLLPDEESEWLTQTDNELCLRHCGYWLTLKRHNPASIRNSVTVRIPTVNVFSSAQLTETMDNVAKVKAL